MARTRDQFTGHVWLKGLDRDRVPRHVDVWEIGSTVDNMDFLNLHGYLTLLQKDKGTVRLTVYPRLDKPPASFARFAACYESCDIPSVLQAAVNDYDAILTGTARPQGTTARVVRPVLYLQGGDPCLRAK